MTITSAIQRFSASTSGAILADAMRRDGCLVIEGMIDAAADDRINDELAPHVARRPGGLGGDAYGDFWGRNAVRFQGLATKSPTYVTEVMLNPARLAIADEILRPNCGDYWISQTETIFIGPGENAQELHRDDLNWSYATAMGIDLQFSVLVAVGDYDAECGATMATSGVAGAMQLWQLDDDDLGRYDGLFSNDPLPEGADR